MKSDTVNSESSIKDIMIKCKAELLRLQELKDNDIEQFLESHVEE